MTDKRIDIDCCAGYGIDTVSKLLVRNPEGNDVVVDQGNCLARLPHPNFEATLEGV